MGRGDDRRSARRAVVGPVVNENWCVTSLDAVVGIEDRRVNDRPEALTGGVRRVRRNQRVDEDLIPFQYLVDWAAIRKRTARFRLETRRGRGPTRRVKAAPMTLRLLRFIAFPFA